MGPSTEMVWREFSGPMRGYLRARTRSSEEADDLLQEIFLRIHRRIDGLREPSRLSGWVFQIARNA
jgi:RNA polymerase sigma-70 factor (ECF subfamily)